MEVLAVFGVNWKLLLIQLVNFGALVFLLQYFLYKPVMKLLEDRNIKIAKGVADAEEAARMRADSVVEQKAVLSQATKDADSMIRQAEERGKEAERVKIKEAQDKSAAILEEATKRGEAEKARLIAESKEEMAKMAVLAAEKILREKLA